MSESARAREESTANNPTPDPFAEAPPAAADAGEWSDHHRALLAIVRGAPGITTGDLHRLYEEIADVVYQGRPSTPVKSNRYRRQLLSDLEAAEYVIGYGVEQGRVWVPIQEGRR